LAGNPGMGRRAPGSVPPRGNEGLVYGNALSPLMAIQETK
jgi:hypothetical protein